MDFVLSSYLTMKVKYLSQRDGVYYFSRRVPTALIDKYGTKQIRLSLNTKLADEAVREVKKLAKKYDLEFAAISASDDTLLKPAQVIAKAEALARQYEYNMDLFIQLVVDPQIDNWQQANVSEDDEELETPRPDLLLPPVERAAYHIIRCHNSGGKRLSDAMNIYLKFSPKRNDEKFVERTKRDVGRFIGQVGDKELSEIRRADTKLFVDWRLQTVKTGSVRRELSTLGAVFNFATTDYELNIPSPFKRIHIENENEDSEGVLPIPGDTHLSLLKQAWHELPSSVALLTILHSELGTRIGELSGLAAADVILDHAIPHIEIRPHPWRRLKNKSSERAVPLTPLALAVIRLALEQSAGSNALFPNYAKRGGNNTASATLNKHWKKLSVKTHQFRHTFKDKLRDIGCPLVIQQSIMGHESRGISESYGKGYSLEMKKKYMDECGFSIETLRS